jgi:hypothetical protein
VKEVQRSCEIPRLTDKWFWSNVAVGVEGTILPVKECVQIKFCLAIEDVVFETYSQSYQMGQDSIICILGDPQCYQVPYLTLSFRGGVKSLPTQGLWLIAGCQLTQ